MLVERRGQVIAVEIGPTGMLGGVRRFSGRRQPSCDGTSRMMREYQVRFCERLGVKSPGGTVLNFVCGLGTMGMKELSHGPTQGTQDTRRHPRPTFGWGRS